MSNTGAVEADQATIVSHPNTISPEVIQMQGVAYTPQAGIIPVDQAKPAENIEEEIEKVAESVIPEFKIDPEFRRLIPPLDAAAKKNSS